MARVRWLTAALDDLDAICAYIAHDSPANGALTAQALETAADALATFPLSGMPLPEDRGSGLRQRLCGRHRIIYRVVSDEVQILKIHHQRQLFDHDSAQDH